ncbi:hypothetical protein RIF29_15570 [Crotalaria pallida]|uniref:Uncharacterized protein n=1 Tax=Crotalaria pallida TaxID=3830 RepID=A0AAN9IBA4_CROPI
MMRMIKIQSILFLVIVVIVASLCVSSIEGAGACRASGKIRGKKPHHSFEDNSESCEGKLYSTFKRSPPVTKRTKGILTLNSFEKGGDGGGASACDNKFHKDNKPVVALSTGWFNHGKRCFKHINIFGNGREVKALVVDECDSTKGCDNNVVDASKAVWEALGVPKNKWGLLDIH